MLGQKQRMNTFDAGTMAYVSYHADGMHDDLTPHEDLHHGGCKIESREPANNNRWIHCQVQMQSRIHSQRY